MAAPGRKGSRRIVVDGTTYRGGFADGRLR
jgi:hypothetical protein